MRTEDNILENVIRLQGQEANAAERDLRGECIAPAAIPPNIRNGPEYGLGRTRRSLQLRQLLSFQQRTTFRREALWSPECPPPCARGVKACPRPRLHESEHGVDG